MKFQIIPQPWGVGLETTICQKYQMWYLWSLQTPSGPADSLKTETIRVSGHILDLYYVWLLSAVPFYENGRNKGKLAGRFFLLFWENDRAAITIISWGFGGCCEPLRRARTEPWWGLGQSPSKFFWFSLYFLMKMCEIKTNSREINLANTHHLPNGQGYY